MLSFQLLKAQFPVFDVPSGASIFGSFGIFESNDRTFKGKSYRSMITLDDHGDTIKLFASNLKIKHFKVAIKGYNEHLCRLRIQDVFTIPKEELKAVKHKLKAHYKYYFCKFEFYNL
jgi:hypothetical protein